VNQTKVSAIRIRVTRKELEMAGWALAFAALTGIGAVLKIPLTPVPVTLQVFFVLLAGLALGPVWGPASQATYLLMGLCGAPFFAAFPYAGPAVLFGPTGGYLWGFIPAAFFVGIIGEKMRNTREPFTRSVTAYAACLAGIVAIYACGAGWLAAWLGGHGKSGWLAYNLGIKPFIVVDLLKGLVAASLVLGGSAAWTRRERKPRA
jgi:biotin transport system substrate-specific component